MENVHKGTELKLCVHIEPIDGVHMADYDFSVDFYTNRSRRIIIRKGEEARMKPIDEDNYMALITTEDLEMLGKGKLGAFITAHIPDGDFPDGFRTETRDLFTNITLT